MDCPQLVLNVRLKLKLLGGVCRTALNAFGSQVTKHLWALVSAASGHMDQKSAASPLSL